VVAAPPDGVDAVQTLLRPYPVTVVPGGATRQASVAAALAVVPAGFEIILVHDAARALAPADVYSRLVAEVRAGRDAVVPGLPVTDTVKQVDAQGVVLATPDRATLRAVQTPQAFRRTVLERAHATVAESGPATDDAALVERLGVAVHVVEGDPRSFKVTTPEDLARAERAVSE
jgi:2-C-methyl-D-erythritol 4-phosphate cytidylyltransferase